MNDKKVLKIIGEVGSIHDGSFGNALKAIDSLASCGVSAVKFQTHIASAETIKDAPNPPYFKGENRYDYFKRTSFSTNQWSQIKEHCESKNVEFVSSPFSLEAVDLLEKVGISSFKIPSGEITNLPLLERVASSGKPVILSSGMSDWKELDTAFEILSSSCLVTILQCSSIYPCPAEQVGLNIISEMTQRYSCPVGFSDHTIGFGAACGAVALGAECIEKHFTFSKKMYGSDAPLAMEPSEFKTYCDELKNLFKAIHSPVDKNNLDCYQDMKKIFEKSIVAKHDLEKGSIIRLSDLAFKKPGTGISPGLYKKLINKRLKTGIAKDEFFSWENVG